MEQKMQLKILLSLSEDKNLLLHLIPQKKKEEIGSNKEMSWNDDERIIRRCSVGLVLFFTGKEET